MGQFTHLDDSEPRQGLAPRQGVAQRTVESAAGCSGIGLHSGAEIVMVLRPAPANTGIVFRRTDVAGDGRIPARWDHVVDTRMCTVLGNQAGTTVGTVEHLMAALAGCGIDNAEVELDGAEVPIMDGSAEPFVRLIRDAGVVDQAHPRRALRVLKSITVEHHGGRVSLAPAPVPSFDFEIDFESRAIARQAISLEVVNGSFCKEIAAARTFGFLNEVEALRAAGLAKGGSLDNAIVINGDRVLNDGDLRFSDEFVRHKVLDAIGDLYLAGGPVIGRFSGVCSGHAANNQLLRQWLGDRDAWAWDVVDGAPSGVADGGLTAGHRAVAVA